MKLQMQDLVSMRDIDSLYEIMTGDEDWMDRLDAAEGLLELGDRRGLEFLQASLSSDIRNMPDYARDILDSPKAKDMLASIETEKKRLHEERLRSGKARLQAGEKVFRYKTVYLMPSNKASDAMFGEEFDVSELNDLGLDGWELVNILSNVIGGSRGPFAGTYLLLKKELGLKDQAGLDQE